MTETTYTAWIMGDDDLVEGWRDVFFFLDFEAGHGQQVRERVARKRRVDEGAKPGF